MLWYRKRKSAVYFSLLGSLVYLLYALIVLPSSSNNDQSGKTRVLSSSTTLQQSYGQEGKSRMQWDNQVPRTRVVQDFPGFVVFDNLFLHQGHYTVVSDDRRIRQVAQSAITGTEPHVQGLDGVQAIQKLGTSGIILPGTTIIFNDPPGPDGSMIYPSNFIGEAALGAWKALATSPTLTALQQSRRMIPDMEEDGQARAAALPSRYIFPKCGRAGTWHDENGQNAWFLTHFSPFAAIEEQGSWMARARSGEVFMLERAVIVDRRAAHAAGGAVDVVGKMSGAIAGLPSKGQDILAPLRTSFFESLGAVLQPYDKPVIVYMDHQSQGRRLIKSHHDRLLQALKGLVDIAEVHVTNIQKLNPTEKAELFGRATVILSVFHDDSINQIFMPPTNRTAVIELYDPGSYAPDWHLVANMVGHRYYPIHFDQIGLRRPGRRVATSGMDGDKLIVDAGFVVKLIRKILTEPDLEKLAKFVDDNTDIDGA